MMFTKFPLLPIEVRLMVWKYALPDPRIVHIRQRPLKELEGEWWKRVRSDLEVMPLDETASRHITESEVISSLEADSQQEFHIGDVDELKELWGFESESPTPAVLLACRESRDVSLKCYQPLFSSLGALPRIYFDSLRDTLFIDHETFAGDYEDLPALIAEHVLPSDLAEVRHLALEGLGPYKDSYRQRWWSGGSGWIYDYGKYLIHIP